jgi:hypothetical protein
VTCSGTYRRRREEWILDWRRIQSQDTDNEVYRISNLLGPSRRSAEVQLPQTSRSGSATAATR